MKERLMDTVKVGEKGQIVIPKAMRDMMDIKTGDSLLILADVKRGIAIPRKDEMDKITKQILNYEKQN